MRYTVGKVELRRQPRLRGQGGPVTRAARLALDKQGTGVFAALTTELAALQPPKNQLAIVVDGNVAAAPWVTSAITAGQIQISYARKDAEALAAKITG